MKNEDDSKIHGELSLSLGKEKILVIDFILMHTFCISIYMLIWQDR